ncbi:MAG: KEOPS complex subunit Pcc1 [Methanolinea sp.]|nr:KEOPS complex subunit Pcc1 [Methanolinea sp.]
MPQEKGSCAHEAVFCFRCAHAAMLYGALFPELAAEENPRSRAECFREGSDTLVLKIRARDIAALRASLNMWLRLVTVADEMQALVSGKREERE